VALVGIFEPTSAGPFLYPGSRRTVVAVILPLVISACPYFELGIAFQVTMFAKNEAAW
jgi:hypothetical protein